jgi:hypothetical protein
MRSDDVDAVGHDESIERGRAVDLQPFNVSATSRFRFSGPALAGPESDLAYFISMQLA